MSDPRALYYSEPELRDPVAIVGFPSVGIVGSIFAGLATRELGLPVVAGITAPDIPPYAFITGGRPVPQIRVAAGRPKVRRKPKSGEEGEKPAKRVKPNDFVVVTSEFAPKPEQSYDIADCILDVLEHLRVSQVVCLEGVAGPGSTDPILGVAGSDAAQEMLESAGIQILADGIVRGLSGSILLEGSYRRMDTMALLVPANPQIPDPRAAARLAEPLGRMFPRLSIDTAPLYAEAEEIDNHIQAQQENPGSGGGIYG